MGLGIPEMTRVFTIAICIQPDHRAQVRPEQDTTTRILEKAGYLSRQECRKQL